MHPGPTTGGPCYDLHTFYYAWYGSPCFEGQYRHWDPRSRPASPAATTTRLTTSAPASTLCSAPTASATRRALVLSWYPPSLADDNGEPSDGLAPSIPDAAHRYTIQVAFHIQPYKGHDDHTVHENIRYITDRYRSHAASCKYKTSTGKSPPLFYIYNSYLTLAESWANLLTPSGSHSAHDTAYDTVFIALLGEEGHKHDTVSAGYNGTYTYFASNGFSFGSSHRSWKAIKAFCNSNNLMFIPSVGPGYIDTSVRPWNNSNTRNRVNGKYNGTALQAALMARPEIVSITSFNEWHEGTQIEKAVPKTMLTRLYLDCLPHRPSTSLEPTCRRAEHFSKKSSG
ncbi:glycoprotein endo-alpha-1,2-mannosidase-like protein [Theristicus caerulescens]